jgi:glutamine amidotransferase
MLAVIDYHCGNLASLGRSLERLGVDFEFSTSPDRLSGKSGIILPGVGHFGFAAERLDALGFRSALISAVSSGVPLLGICLGMQLLFESSDEAEDGSRGLALLAGRVESLRSLGVTSRVPHVGWNALELRASESLLLQGVESTDDVYFVHSFAARVADDSVVKATTSYDVDLTAVVEQGCVFGAQFHPEKSSVVGGIILRNFANITC